MSMNFNKFPFKSSSSPLQLADGFQPAFSLLKTVSQSALQIRILLIKAWFSRTSMMEPNTKIIIRREKVILKYILGMGKFFLVNTLLNL